MTAPRDHGVRDIIPLCQQSSLPWDEMGEPGAVPLPAGGPLSKVVNRRSTTGIGKSSIRAKLRATARDMASQVSQDPLQRSRLSAALSHQNEKALKSGTHPFKVSETEQISACTVSQHGLGTWEGSLITKGGLALGSQDGRHLIFSLNMGILSWAASQATQW